ncbi:MAG: hypothetical protein ACP5SH_13900 [Syntrophobacteraceae bacterium]
MAEIKSTLELVLERTQHLHMTEEDKRKQSEKEFSEALCRLVSKQLDGQLGLERFKDELGRLDELDGARTMRAAAEICGRIDPASDNSALLDLIEKGLGLDVSGMETALKRFGEKLRAAEDLAAEKNRTVLLQRGVSGAAVIPNLDADAQWQEKRREMVETVKGELAAQLNRRG